MHANHPGRRGTNQINDARLKLQSAANTLKHIDPAKITDHDEIEDYLEGADKSLGSALRSPKTGSGLR